MAETVGTSPIPLFTAPINGTSPISADEVRINDLAIRSAYNTHESDGGLHFQSSTLGTRPGAGTQGRKWFTTDERRIYYDNGAAWVEAAYLPLVGGTLTGNLVIGTDPSGSELLRVGGSARVGGVMLVRQASTGVYAPSIQVQTATDGDVYRLGMGRESFYVANVVVGRDGGAGATSSYLAFETRDSVGTLKEAARFNGNGHFLPAVNNTVDLGQSAFRWRDGYFAGEIFCGKVLAADVSGTIGSFNSLSVAVTANFTTSNTLSASAGGASALPATPVGYLRVNINSTPRLIPFYAV